MPEIAEVRTVAKTLNNSIVGRKIIKIDIPYKNIIKSDIDEGKDDENLKIFKLLKLNSFISREYLYPIYEYFSDLFYRINDIKENDKIMKKMYKVFEIWKILYNFNIEPNKIKDFNSSSYCFIGGGLKVNFTKEIRLDNKSIIIKIEVLNNITFKFNNNLIFIRIEDEENEEPF